MDAPFPEGLLPCIEAFLKDDHLRPAGKDLYDEVFETDLFFPLQRKAEMRRMIQIARTVKPKVVMEIGADKGGGIYHWAKCLPTVTTILINEIRGVPYGNLLIQHFPKVGFALLEGGSREPVLLDWVRQCLTHKCLTYDHDGMIDVLFIDGDKTTMFEDFHAYLPMMNPHGVVFIHDVSDREPERAFQRICKEGWQTETIHDISDYLEEKRREELKRQPRNSYEGWLRHWKGTSCGVGCIYLGGKP